MIKMMSWVRIRRENIGVNQLAFGGDGLPEYEGLELLPQFKTLLTYIVHKLHHEDQGVIGAALFKLSFWGRTKNYIFKCLSFQPS
jgi:hypothetical protein